MIYLIVRDKKFSNKEKFIRIKKINSKFTLIMFVKEKISHIAITSCNS